ncbi:MAG: protein kinase domain-containing protein, partial [Vicinamibacterales bacterium]
MDRERWEHLERLYHAALARSAEERAAFLTEACAGDERLRRDLESLLARATSEGILASPVAVLAGLADPDATVHHHEIRSGTMVGPYRIDRLLGRGGMGEVYRAHDTKLGRDVAIKVLPPAFALDRDRLSRFEREARVLAALNHPNIAAIYGFEQAGDIRGLVLELVEGPTLAER